MLCSYLLSICVNILSIMQLLGKAVKDWQNNQFIHSQQCRLLKKKNENLSASMVVATVI